MIAVVAQQWKDLDKMERLVRPRCGDVAGWSYLQMLTVQHKFKNVSDKGHSETEQISQQKYNPMIPYSGKLSSKEDDLSTKEIFPRDPLYSYSIEA